MLAREYCFRDLFGVCAADCFVRQSLLQKLDYYLYSLAFPFIKAIHVYTRARVCARAHTHNIVHIYCSSGKEEIKKEIDTSLHMCSKAY